MKIALINETSAVDKNKSIYDALLITGHEVVNAGMKSRQDPELTYIETGFMGALLLNCNAVDFVVGGCGTGQGFLNSIMLYPNIFCGLVANSLDGWLYAQINGGNSVSLALNKGFGWAGEVNLQFIFEKMFSVEWGQGFPAHRKASQQASIKRLKRLSCAVHKPFEEILDAVDKELVQKVLHFPGIKELLSDTDIIPCIKKLI